MTTLQPIVRQRLLEFRRRRNLLLTIKGLSAAVLVAILVGLFGVAIDARWALSLSARWIIAGTIYLIVAILIAILAIGPSLRGRSLAWLANMFEQAEPKMKDRLLAAIELSNEFSHASTGRSNKLHEQSTLDSAAFRRAVQQSAARRIESIKVVDVLPWQLVKPWIMSGAVILGGVTVLCLIPNLYLANRLGRILLPMVNIGRVSKFAIEITQPSPTNQCIPEEHVVSVQAVVHGDVPSSVILETESLDGKERRTQSMHSESDSASKNLFQIHWTPTLGKTRYRVVAGDASTAWYQIDVRPFPKVEKFSIDYRYPDYTREPNKTIHSELGNLEAIAGTIASVLIIANQAISEGELRLQAKDRSLETENLDTRIPLVRSREGQWTADVPIDRDATYRVDLVASETRFTNTFSPKYTIHAITDRSPTIRWTNPTEPSLAVQANHLLDLSAVIEDELPIVSLTQQIKSRNNDWLDQSVPVGELAEQEAHLVLDLGPLNVKPGDMIQTRLVAIDRKGLSTTSTILELVVSSMSLDPNRQKRMRDRVEVAKQVEAFHEKMEEQSKSIRVIRDEWKKDQDNPSLKQQLNESIGEFSAIARHESIQLRRKIAEALPKLEDSVSALEFELIAQNVARIETENLSSIERMVQQSEENPRDHKAIEQSTEQVDKLIKSTNQIARRTKDFVGHDVLSQIGQDLSILLRHQQELRSSIDELLPEQYRRRQMLVARQMQDLSELFREQLPVLQNRSERTGKQWSEWMETQVRKIYEVTGKDSKPLPAQEIQSDREKLAKQIEEELQKHQNAGNIDGGSPQEQLQARKEMREKVDSSSNIIQRLAKSTSQLNQPKLAEDAEAEITQQLTPALEQLAIHRELQQARHDGDNQFVADLGEAYRAAQVVLRDRRIDPMTTSAKLEDLSKSMRTLEAIHDLEQASQTLEQLHSTERWKSSSLEARFEQPRVWDAFRQQISQSIQALSSVKVASPTVSGIQTLQKGDLAQRVDSKIGPRRWTSASTASAAQEIEALQGELRTQMATLSEVANEARKSLADYTPKVADLAREAAEKTRTGSEETKRLGQAIADGEVPELAPRIEQLKASVESNEPALEQLREALADVASRQDLLQQSDAEIARDADASIAITNDLEKRIGQSMEAIAETTNDTETRHQLDTSANIQDQAAKSLDQIAIHFEAINEAKENISPTSDAKPSTNAIAEAAKDVAHQPEMDRAHAEAERLRRLASLDPKLVLEQLEKELARNKPMRIELSNIAEDAVEGALQTLEFTADRENEMSVGLENSDLDFSRQKERTRASIQRVAKDARSISDTLAPRVQSTADQTPSRDSRKDVQRMRDDLSNAIKATEAIDSGASMHELMQSAKKLETQLEYFQRGMGRQAATLDTASETQTAMNENQRRDQKRAMEDLQSRYREEDVPLAFAQERSRQQETQLAEQERKRATQNIEQKKRDLDQAQRQVEKNGETDANLQDIENRQTQLGFAEADLKWAEQQRAESEARQAAAKTAREKLQMSELQPLNAPNPAAQFSSRTALAASLAAQAAVEQLRYSIGQPEKSDEPNAGIQALRDAALHQEGLKKGIEDAAQALARASRHEERLANPEVNAMIQQQAAQVAAIAHESMQQVKDTIESAANETEPGSPNHPAKASGPSTRQSQQLLETAEQALREQAASLRKATNREKTPSSNPGNSTSDASAAAKKENGLLSPQEMAQMLDELDQQLNARPEDTQASNEASSSQKNAKSSSSKPGPPTKSGAPGDPSDAAADERAQTLADAAQRLAAEMNQQRQAMESAAKTMPDTGAPDSQSRSATQPGKSSSGIVMPVEIANLEDWGKLRQQSAENALEGDREQMLPAYRQQIEEYFRILSKRQPTK